MKIPGHAPESHGSRAAVELQSRLSRVAVVAVAWEGADSRISRRNFLRHKSYGKKFG